MAYWCMPFLPCSLFSLFTSLFLFSLLFLFQFPLFLAFVLIPSSIYGYYSYLYWVKRGISLFYPYCSPTIFFFVCCKHLFSAAHWPTGRSSSTTPGHAQCFLFLPLLISWQTLIRLVRPRVFLSLIPTVKPWVFLYLSLWHASGGPNHLLPILGKNTFLTKNLPKEALGRYQK